MSASPAFTLLTAPCGPGTQVTIRGELDLAAAPDLARELARLHDSARGALVLHLGGVEFIDCGCARLIARAIRTWPGGQAVICDPSLPVRRLFQITGLAVAPPPRARIPAQGQPATQETRPAAMARP